MKSIKLNFVYNVLLNVSSVIFPLITAPYVARVLEPDGVGLFNFAGTYAGYFALVALLGIPTYGVREVSKLSENKQGLAKFVSEMMSIALITTIVITAIYILSIAIVGQLNENYVIFLLAGFVVYLAPFKINWYYQGIEEFGFITFRTLIIRVLGIICLFLFVHEKDDLIIYLIINVSSSVIADVWNFTKMWRAGVHPFFTVKGLKKHLKPLWILFASSIAISIYTVLDTLMLGFIKDYTEVGYYNNALHLSRMLLIVVTSLSVVSVPRFSSYINKGMLKEANGLANKSFSFVGLLAFPISIGLICITPTFVPWFFGKEFYGAIVPLEILSVLNVTIGFSNILGVQILVGLNKEKSYLRCILIGTISNFVLNCIFIPSIGAIGASIASVTAEFFVTFSMFFFVYKETPVRVEVWTDLTKSLFGALLFIPLKLILPVLDNSFFYLVLFVLSSVIIYSVTQLVLRNSLALNLWDAAKNKLVKIY
jgi:O-antigen/teichoic acid export membrane protein